MDPDREERDGEPSDVPPRLMYRDPSDRNDRQANDHRNERQDHPSLVETESSLRIEMVIRAVRERRSRRS